MAQRTIARKDFQFSGTLGKELPVGIGANFNDDPICRRNLRKSHTTGASDVQHPDDAGDVSNFVPEARYDALGTMVSTSQAYGSGASGAHLKARATLEQRDPVPPHKADETVLRFLGYYSEPIPESPDESVRVHKVALLFHCVDATVLLREAAQVNSGLPQGVVLKRQTVPKPAGGTVSVLDLNIGAAVDIFGKKVNIVDCSDSTRDYLQNVCGRAVPDRIPWPADDTYNAAVSKKLQTHPRRQLPTNDFDHKRALEAMRGSGVISKHAPDDVRTAQQFLRNRINEHLQFAAFWDDRGRLSGDLRLVVIRYYLENDTIEIVENREENSGREGANKLLCRQRVSHPHAPNKPPGAVQQNTFGLLVKSDFLTFDDLAVGTSIRIAGNTYTIYDADSFTRKWYEENRSVKLNDTVDISSVVAKGTVKPPTHFPPPHIGFGSEEDSLRSCKSLLLKPPPIDTAKQQREAGKVMIFRASLHKLQQPEDAGREFVVCFHRASDEVEITERQLRNSGIVGGKFLAKGRHLKHLPDGRQVPYEASDFCVGGVVQIAGRTFRLDSIDERSRRIVAGEVDDISESRVKTLVVAFRELLNSKFYRAHEAYRAIAPEGSLTAVQLRQFFERSASDITEEEANHLVHYFSSGDGSGRISYDRFLKIMDPGNTANLDEASNSTRSVKGVAVFPRSSTEGAAHAKALQATCDAAADEATTRRLHKSLASKLLQRRGTLQEAFRMLAGHAPNARLKPNQMSRSLDEVLRLSVSDRERNLLLAAMYTNDSQRERGLDFREFSDFVDAV
uniref:EF-hand domain-containing family member C2 n=1 Tax=Neobodo designis TaxID=312471 RepID=A0A7S1LQW8_NEODS|mmetsp:Transcript_26536/g.81990  ORF Transcript_26536/g.81990 Transcript_26536/m.81990 type:complete len:791 (+) Transcript_26536:28-2400(+)|eukprot:CAMPEP_0174833962 /NCGR_PEP_ID=MMETSP1114-20130205/4549_1 /TAXON_ID=312471 /ORGANISM="Neobodo designis, Strain CCAP 1951/1" /LENGTH=790 /DNA_ID=CAMNT_0016067865 /DNA_START=27 /DNA_END=2399 /DNA_ORIENTATION=-